MVYILKRHYGDFLPDEGRIATDDPQRATANAGLVNQLRIAQILLSTTERIALWHEIYAGYCKVCGDEDPEGHCQCWNDE